MKVLARDGERITRSLDFVEELAVDPGEHFAVLEHEDNGERRSELDPRNSAATRHAGLVGPALHLILRRETGKRFFHIAAHYCMLGRAWGARSMGCDSFWR